MADIDIKRARYFLALCETLNFSDAAKKLGISQPGLTKAINQLEKDIGATLIRREGRNTHLTPLGTVAIEHFQRLITLSQAIDETLEKLVSGEMPVLRIGVMCTIGPGSLTRFLTQFKESQEDIEIIIKTLTACDLEEVILAGSIDIAIVGAEVKGKKKLRYKKLYNEPMVVVTALSHPFAGKGPVSLSEISREPYVDRLQCEFRETFLTEITMPDFKPNFIARCDSEEWARSLIAEGAGISIVPKYSFENPNLASVELSGIQLERTVSLAIPFGRLDTNIVQRFLRAADAFDWPDE